LNLDFGLNYSFKVAEIKTYEYSIGLIILKDEILIILITNIIRGNN